MYTPARISAIAQVNLHRPENTTRHQEEKRSSITLFPLLSSNSTFKAFYLQYPNSYKSFLFECFPFEFRSLKKRGLQRLRMDELEWHRPYAMCYGNDNDNTNAKVYFYFL